MSPAQRETLGHILSEGLSALPERTRRVLWLRYVGLRDVAGIAQELATDERTVRRLLAEGHGALRGMVAPSLRRRGWL